MTTPGRFTMTTAGMGRTPVFATSAETARSFVALTATNPARDAFAAERASRPDDCVDGCPGHRDADDDDTAVAEGVIDLRGKAARGPCRRRPGGRRTLDCRLRRRRDPCRGLHRRRSSRDRGWLAAERSAAEEEHDRRQTREDEGADERGDTYGWAEREAHEVGIGRHFGRLETIPEREEARSPAPLLDVQTRRPGLRAGRVVL